MLLGTGFGFGFKAADAEVSYSKLLGVANIARNCWAAETLGLVCMGISLYAILVVRPE